MILSYEGQAAVPLAAQCAYFGVFSLTNALYYDRTGAVVQEAAEAVAAEARWRGDDAPQDRVPAAKRGFERGTDASSVPPFFIVFTLNTCVSVLVQAVSTFVVFQHWHSSVRQAYFMFACMAATGAGVIPACALLKHLGCLRPMATSPEAVYRPTHLAAHL